MRHHVGIVDAQVVAGAAKSSGLLYAKSCRSTVARPEAIWCSHASVAAQSFAIARPCRRPPAANSWRGSAAATAAPRQPQKVMPSRLHRESLAAAVVGIDRIALMSLSGAPPVRAAGNDDVALDGAADAAFDAAASHGRTLVTPLIPPPVTGV
jgi:hypothetical protein